MILFHWAYVWFDSKLSTKYLPHIGWNGKLSRDRSGEAKQKAVTAWHLLILWND